MSDKNVERKESRSDILPMLRLHDPSNTLASLDKILSRAHPPWMKICECPSELGCPTMTEISDQSSSLLTLEEERNNSL